MALAVLVSLGLSVYSARTIQLQFQFRDFFDYPGNPQLPLFKKNSEDFGDPAGYVVAMIESQDAFRPETLRYVEQLTRALEPNPEFKRVRSLTNAHAIRGQGDEVQSGALLPQIPTDASSLQEIKQFVLNSPLLRRRLVSDDAKTTAVLAEMRTPAVFSSIAEQTEALGIVEAALAANPPPGGIQVRVTGAPAVEVGTTDALIKDQLLLIPGVISVLAGILYLLFRSMHGILLCLGAVNVALIWTFGIFALFGRPVDIVGSVIPTTILAYGVVDPIFVLARVLRKLRDECPKHDAIVEAYAELGLPCFVTSLTTAVGFAAFASSRVPSIQVYGITVAVGVGLAFVTTVVVLPLLLSFAPTPRQKFAALNSTRWIDEMLTWVWNTLRRRVGATIVVACVALALGGLLGSRQRINNQYVDGLPQGQVHSDVRLMEDTLAGTIRLIVHLEGQEGSMKDPEVLKAIESVDEAIGREPAARVSVSLSDLVGEANQAFHGGDAAQHVVPSSKALIAQYLALVDPIDRAEFVTNDFSRSHVAVLLKDQGSREARAFAQRFQEILDASQLGELGVTATLTGNGVVAYQELDGVVYELMVGFAVALLLIIVLQFVAFRSLRIALISIIPNLLPVAACLVTFRALSIDMKIDNAVVFCIAIGGLFNTTIHFVAQVQQRVARGEREPDTIILESLRAIGPASLITAGAVSAGFAVLLLSRFPGLQALGLLSAITLMVGFVADMLVTPALIRVLFKWRVAPAGSASLSVPRTATLETNPTK